jgi:uncharacterized protein with GYD domain
MAVSMIQFSYKPETLANLVKNPEDRSVVVRQLIEKLGGRLLAFYYSYGEYDGLCLAEMPDHVSGLAAIMTSFAQGGLTNIKTTVLITVQEAMEAMKKASDLTLPQPRG